MTRPALRPPEPPHDPKSLLLNGIIGFRNGATTPGLPPVTVNSACCTLELPRLPSAIRDLAEPTGSLGGIRPPSNVAVGPRGGIFLLEAASETLKRFDPCECRFDKVPHVGGNGGGARQFRRPRAIAVACSNLYVCDTGVAAKPAENHRVSVFALKGFALRGHLVPPKSKRPWTPISVAVDSLGRVWVGDAERRLHRFTPSGLWGHDWPLPFMPRHLAIDCRDLLYIVYAGAPTPLVVLDAEARPIAQQPHTPDDIRAGFPKLPFAVDPAGNLWLEPCCRPDAIKKANPNANLVFDGAGLPVEVDPVRTDVFERSAEYRSLPLDSHIAQCVWHRIQLFGALPVGTQVRVRTFCADEILAPAELDVLADWRECAVADVFDSGGRWDCLVRSTPGRYLWLELTFLGTGSETPAIGAIVVEFPRVSLRRFLPAVFGMEPVSADFTDRLLSLFDTLLRGIERQIDRMALLFDPASAPAATKDRRQVDFLTWLGTWIGIALDRNWDVETRRRFLKHAGSLFDRRGTLSGLRQELLLLLNFAARLPCVEEPRSCGVCAPAISNCFPPQAPEPPEFPPLVLEHFRLRRWLRLGAGCVGDEAVVWGERIIGRTRLGVTAQANVTRPDTSPDPARDAFLAHASQFSVFVPARCATSPRNRRAFENLLKTEAPAGTRGYLQLVEPRFRIGIQSMLGFDSVIAAVPEGMRLGETPLGGSSILTGPPHMQGGPTIAVGKDGRIGTTTLLS